MIQPKPMQLGSAILKAACSAALSLACIFGFAQKQQPSTEPYALLWEISGKGMDKPSYLFGSYNTVNKRLFHFSDSVLVCLDRCDSYVMEVHPESIVQASYAASQPQDEQEQHAASASEKEDTTHVEVPDHLANKSAAWVRRNYLPEYTPPKERHPCVMDIHLYDLARRHGKSILGLQAAGDGQADGISQHEERKNVDQAIDLEASLRSHADMQQRMQNAYYSGNLKEVNALTRKAFANDTAAYAAMFVRQNRVLADSLAMLLKGDQSLFISLGVGYLAGEESVIALLKRQGYTLRPVKATFTRSPWAYTFRSAEQPVPLQRLSDVHLGFEADAPGSFFPNESNNFGGTSFATMDLPSGFVFSYSSIMLSPEQLEMDPAMILPGLSYTFAGLLGMRVVNSKSLSLNGHQGQEAEFTGSGAITYMRLAYFIRDHDLFVVSVSNTNPKPNTSLADKFISSMKLMEPERNALVAFEEPKHGFGMNWYATPSYSNEASSWDENTYEVTAWEHTWTWYNLVDGLQASLHLRHTAGSIQESDYKKYLNKFRINFSARQENEATWITYKGKDALKCVLKDNGKVSAEAILFMHHGRFYNLEVNYKSGQYKPTLAQQFWDGFTLTEPEFVPFKRHDDLGPGLSLSLPRYLEELDRNADGDVGSLNNCKDAKRWRARSEGSNFFYLVEWQQLSPYQYFENHDSLAWTLMRSLISLDTSSKFHLVRTEEKDWGNEYTFLKVLEKCDMTFRCKVLVTGEDVYAIVALVPSDLADESPYLEPLKSYTVKAGKPRGADPLKAILDNFEDGERSYDDRHLAMDGLLNSDWQRPHLKRMVNACTLGYPDETGGPPAPPDERQPFFAYAREALLATLSFQDSLEGLHAPLQELYDDLPKNSRIRAAGLVAMAQDSSTAAVEFVCSKLKAEKPELWTEVNRTHVGAVYELTELICRSKGLMEAAAPSVPALMQKPGIGDYFTSLGIACVDSGVLPPAQLEAFRQRWLDSAAVVMKRHERWAKRQSFPKELLQYTYTEGMSDYLDWIGHLPRNASTTAVLRRYAACKYNRFKLAAVLALMRSGERVDEQALSALAERHELRAELVEEMKELDMLELLPGQYKTQDMAAMAQLAAYVDASQWPTRQMTVKGARLFLDEGKAVRVFMVEFDWNGNSSFIGFAGPFNEDKTSLESDGEFTYTEYLRSDADELEVMWKDMMGRTGLKAME